MRLFAVGQVRLDFLELELAGLEGGVCDPGNRLAISTGPGQVIIFSGSAIYLGNGLNQGSSFKGPLL